MLLFRREMIISAFRDHPELNLNLLIIVICLMIIDVKGLDNGLALVPPMGWITGERFSCLTDCANYPDDCISERLVKSMVDILSLNSFQTAGYRYVILDDCWMDAKRDSKGRLRADVRRFPSGIEDLVAYVHSKNLKIGLYLDIGSLTCGGFPGSQGNYALDALTMANWKVDMVKVGACGISTYTTCNTAYPELGHELNLTGRPILYQCEWPAAVTAKGGGEVGNFTTIAKTCNIFTTYSGIQDIWDSLLTVFNFYYSAGYLFADQSGPGSFSNPDQLVLGNFGLSLDQAKFQMALWSIVSAPLFISADLRTMNSDAKKVLLNAGAIRINQDQLGQMGQTVSANAQVFIWKKSILPTGSYAVAIFYTTIFGQPVRESFALSDFSITGAVFFNVTETLTGVYHGLYRPWQTIDCEINPMGALLFEIIAIDNSIII